MPDHDPLDELIGDGLVRREGARLRTTARWQAAMARAALVLQKAGAPWGDLKLPITVAVLEHYGTLADEEIARLVEAMLPIEAAELASLIPAPPPTP